MSKTVLANPGAIGISFAEVTDKYEIIANTIMLSDRLFGGKADINVIKDSLLRFDLDATCENIDNVKAFFSPEYNWGDGDL